MGLFNERAMHATMYVRLPRMTPMPYFTKLPTSPLKARSSAGGKVAHWLRSVSTLGENA